ncbi:hypothetical protein TWF106_008303 [Orbilia oligospora]|uniref:Uncharacterized protein n=1 Tax=Orbilia oligospora TaxID=2813651 RepID=A0A6G1MGP8_ORBOL|nr:hypothetical protein TWF679_007854 [Orbilia oligospora]KAF3227899.1 hypothetical protein TWF106_008303 [Orbilia oligospora]KAF3231512.1 hypothetical protein TWF191_005581 [Orbilia oligospora]KAF3257665.1 hypothetical protein TWF192_000955 [Orbilia oligospora]
MDAYVDEIYERSQAYHEELDAMIAKFDAIDAKLTSHFTEAKGLKEAIGPEKAKVADAMMRKSGREPPAEAKNWAKSFDDHLKLLNLLESQAKETSESFKTLVETIEKAFTRVGKAHGPIPTFESEKLGKLSEQARNELKSQYQDRQKSYSEEKGKVGRKMEKLFGDFDIAKSEVQGLKDWLGI